MNQPDHEKPVVRGVDVKGLLLEEIGIDGWQRLIWSIFTWPIRSILGRAIESTPEARLKAAEKAARMTFNELPPEQQSNAELNAQALVNFNSTSNDAARKARVGWDLGPDSGTQPDPRGRYRRPKAS